MDNNCYAVYRVWGVRGQYKELVEVCANKEDALRQKMYYSQHASDYAGWVVEPVTGTPPSKYGTQYGRTDTARNSHIASKNRVKRL